MKQKKKVFHPDENSVRKNKIISLKKFLCKIKTFENIPHEKQNFYQIHSSNPWRLKRPK